MKISVIVPVGDNVQWKKCQRSLLESIAAYGDDTSFEVLPCYDLQHAGAYFARNEGLSKATGDWIAWVDCDDEVDASWAFSVARATEDHLEADIIQFDAIENRHGKERVVKYRYAGVVSGDAFAHELLRNDGMPSWLWTRVFKRTLFEGLQFEGRVKHDYGMFLKLLPRVKSIWSIGKPLYHYNRNGTGLSAYAQQMDYAEAGSRFEKSIAALPEEWQYDAKLGLALTMADVARHSRQENGSRQFVRKYLKHVLFDGTVPLRLKAKALLAAMGI